ncbi:MAG TPA: TetR/AcrR family transcriptional regulator [Acidimicrobiales bacterium]|jgi:AcrR family transcriptional regulator|nr:TetR/AcrR family transcriptional regulator [Acidimicrobiales bacterium]
MAATARNHTGVPPLSRLRASFDRLIERPDPKLDEALNAATACFARHGLAHTSVPDIAREMGVSKATVYRQIGSVDDVVRLLLAREAHLLIDTLEHTVGDATGPDALLDVVTAGIGFASDHPLITKVLRDEPDLAGELLPLLPEFAGATRAALQPAIVALLDGADTVSPPGVLADLVVRLTLAALLVTPPDLAAHVRQAFEPHLRPT